MYWERDKSPGLLTCTVHTRGPNRGIGRQKSNRVGLIPRKQNGGFPQEASNLVFNDAVGQGGEKNDQQNSVTEEGSNGAYHSIFMELAVEDTPKFFEFIRMSYPKFLELVKLIG